MCSLMRDMKLFRDHKLLEYKLQIDCENGERYNENKKGRGGMKQEIMQELVSGILSIMQDKVERIVLYGSVARGTNTEDSDVDVALLMKGNLERDTEDKLSDFIVDLNLKYDKIFSVIDIDIEKFSIWEKVTPFYQNVNREGIVLWKAA